MRTGHRVLTTSRYAQRRRRRRRSSGGIPPHTPSCWPVDTAQSRHSVRTGHDLQISTATLMSRAVSANHRADWDGLRTALGPATSWPNKMAEAVGTVAE